MAKITPQLDQLFSKAASEFVKNLRVADYNPAGVANYSYYQGRQDEWERLKHLEEENAALRKINTELKEWHDSHL